MRASFTLFLVLAAAACGNGTNPGNGGDDQPATDAPPGSDPDAPIQPPERGFQVVTPFVELPPGAEITYCYYFKTPNTAPMAIKRWQSSMTPGSHHMIMYTSSTERKPAGTIDTASCGFGAGSGTNQPVWTYSAQTPDADLAMPTDDGTGKPLAMEIAAGQPAFFQMHYYNPSDQVLQVRVTLNAYALDEGAPFTKTAPFITYYGDISIPPNAVNHVEPDALTKTACTTPPNSQFWLMSTHAHKQAVKTRVYDGAGGAMVFESTDWEHPVAREWNAAPFGTFSSGKLAYECTYTNIGDNKNDTIVDGDSAVDNEMCMAAGYYFVPGQNATAKFCYNNFVIN